MSYTLAVDCMGGDFGPEVTVPACKAFLEHHPSARLVMVGLADALRPLLQRHGLDRDERVAVVACTEVVTMDDAVEVALRRKKDSSLRVALNQVKDGAAHACVSAGNTGALMAVARYVLKTLPGIDRPAIATWLPNQKGEGTLMLDLGANVDCTAEHLLQFAIMGTALEQAAEGKEHPTVGLLNIGEEVIKGNDTIKQAGELLRQVHAAGGLNFHGNVEGDDIFKGTTDIVVSDGFVGNVALKTSEGLAQMIGAFLKQEFTKGPFSKVLALVASPVLLAFKKRVDHRRYNGAALIGLKGLVVKSHGGADVYAFEQALHRAYEAASHGVVERIEAILARTAALHLSAAPAAATAQARAA
jgi:glycerol-3-phosphate acyltransferase PlsX